jgi:hypothetical protein
VSHFFNVWWNRSTFPQVVGWFGRECFCVTPRRRSSAEKPFDGVASGATGYAFDNFLPPLPCSVALPDPWDLHNQSGTNRPEPMEEMQ